MENYDYENDGGFIAAPEIDGDRKGLYTFDNGDCDFNANGFDCRDCGLAYRCPNYRNFD